MNKKVITYAAIAVLIIGLTGLLFILNRSSEDEATSDDQTTDESNETDQNSEDEATTDDQTTDESNETDQNSGSENTDATTNIENSLCSGAELTLQQREACDTSNNNDESGNSNQTQPDPVDDSSGVEAGLYLDYSSAGFNQHADKNRWLFFHADWCPLCVNLEEDIMAHLGDIPDDLVIFKVDFDNSDNLRNRYGVSIQTTIVSVDGDGDKIKLHVASLDQSLANLIANLS